MDRLYFVTDDDSGVFKILHCRKLWETFFFSCCSKIGQIVKEKEDILITVIMGDIMGFPGGSDGKESAWSEGDLAQSLGREDPLEEEMGTHSSILACRILWTENLAGYSHKELDTTEQLIFTLTFT